MLSERVRETILAASVAASVSGLVSFGLQRTFHTNEVPKAPAPNAVESLRHCALVCNGHRVMAIQWEGGNVSRCECDFAAEEVCDAH